jgi:hypothetical protein
MTSNPSIGLRAGFWRRLFAISIDSIIVSVLFQVIAAALFAVTSGEIQTHGDVAYTTCVKLEKVPEGLAPPPPADVNVARRCDVYFLGLQTGRILQLGHVAKEGALARAQTYMLDREGRAIDAISLDWVAAPLLILYLILMETRAGATFGGRAMAIRVVDVMQPASPAVALHKIVLRYLAMLIGFLPLLVILIVDLGIYGSPDDLREFLASLSAWETFMSDGASWRIQWRPYLLDLPERLLGPTTSWPGDDEWPCAVAVILANLWMIFLAVQVALKRDPVYDRLAGTAVLRELSDSR